MYFNIDYATEKFIDGWLAPDNPAITPRFRIETDKSGTVVLEANILRADIVNARLHDTGWVGFRFDDHNVPGFSESAELSITELTGNHVIYRRTKNRDFLQSKLFLINNIPVPSKYIRRILGEQFLISYPVIDETGIETAINLLRNPSVNSIYAEGRFRVAKHVRALKEFGFHLSALIEDPFTELANRLLVVKTVLNMQKGEAALDVLSPFYSALKDCVSQLESTSLSEVNTVFSKLNPIQKSVLCDPLTRMLACGDNEEPEPRHVSLALTTLSDFDSVGITSELDTYKQTILPQIPRLDLTSLSVAHINSAFELAETLRRSNVIRKLLRNDTKIHAMARQSVLRATGVDDLRTGEHGS